ncbi:MAG: hypothetical protein BECKG1743D_GA0114223_112481, partial [Candidatus Kentron sp. G]
MVLGTLVFLDRAKIQHDIQEQRLDKMRVQYRQLDEEITIVNTYFPRFQRLVQDGFIGEERRLTWLEALRDASARIELPGLRYNISSRQPYHVSNFPVDTGIYQIHATQMQLTMGLLHEGDLFFLLRELERHGIGLYSTVYCRLRRVVRESWRDPAKCYGSRYFGGSVPHTGRGNRGTSRQPDSAHGQRILALRMCQG